VLHAASLVVQRVVSNYVLAHVNLLPAGCIVKYCCCHSCHCAALSCLSTLRLFDTKTDVTPAIFSISLSRGKIASVTWHVAHIFDSCATPFQNRAMLCSVQLCRAYTDR